MTKLKLFGAAALALSSALAGPAMAQQAISHPGLCSQHHPNANCMTKGPLHPYPYTSRARAPVAYRDSWNNGGWAYRNDGWNNGWNDDRAYRRDPGFWPGDVAADVVGGAVATADAAVGTAGAIAAAPFNGDSYAYYNDRADNGWSGYNGWNNQSYAEHNGFVCTPGTWFKGEDGRNHICQ